MKTTKPVTAKKPPVKQAKRDPEATRARILNVAVAEFAANGYSGVRIDQLALHSKANVRMIYYYFGGKEKLYIEVLEYTLGKLREEELTLDFSTLQPLDGLMRMFDFLDCHFSAHPELMNLLSSENLNRARFMKKSSVIPAISSPMMWQITSVLQRGAKDGTVRAGIDPLHLYVTFVSLSYFHKSNAYTLSWIFETDMHGQQWKADHRRQTQQMLLQYLTSPSASARQPRLSGARA